MNTYTATFTGRKVGSIGLVYYLVVFVKGNNREEATDNLYKDYEHISGLSLKKH